MSRGVHQARGTFFCWRWVSRGDGGTHRASALNREGGVTPGDGGVLEVHIAANLPADGELLIGDVEGAIDLAAHAELHEPADDGGHRFRCRERCGSVKSHARTSSTIVYRRDGDGPDANESLMGTYRRIGSCARYVGRGRALLGRIR